MPKEPEVLAHLQWLGYVQPVGLVVSIPALVRAQAFVNRNIAPAHQRFLGCLDGAEQPAIGELAEFTAKVLEWDSGDLCDLAHDVAAQQELEVPLPEYHETLRPTHAVRELKPRDPAHPWMMLVTVLPKGQDFDTVATQHERQWQASPQARCERLLRETGVPIGLLCNGGELRLVYAPRGESSGYLTFRVREMAEVAGRPIFAALHMLLCAERLFTLPEKQRLPAILAESRQYQNTVSNQLAEQVLAALYELLRGFQAADAARHGELLHEALADEPNHVYAGLLTVLMRLVFVLYAEDRDMLSSDSIYANYYSVSGLFDRLRADAGRYPDTMDQRYGAWAQLLALFRLVYEGGSHGALRLPAREGYLFDPDRFPFLEGRPWRSRRRADEKLDVPHVSDGVVYRVLSNLLLLDGERLSYRTLDVEQIGSVYEAVMGFDLQRATGHSIAIKPAKPHGAPAAIDLDALLNEKAADRLKWLTERTDQKLGGAAGEALKRASSIEELLAALEKKIALAVTPRTVAKGDMVLQPSDERRRSGSHYTPRSLTEPIVRTTLRPVLEQLGERPTPAQILDLKVCDPAMGSGAFLVEACRQLGDRLVEAWHAHDCLPPLPPDEDELLHARRLVAQRCLYGVDKNPMAVDLARLSLWLVTLAKEHPFTFLDHSLRAGDSLVGLGVNQIAGFHWAPAQQVETIRAGIEENLNRALGMREAILAARDDMPYEELQRQLAEADQYLDFIRLVGDLVVEAFFSGGSDRARLTTRERFSLQLQHYLSHELSAENRRPLEEAIAPLRNSDRPIAPFHWEVEYPEVFRRENPGFDAVVGNPPFMGGTWISGAIGAQYLDWLKFRFPGGGSRADLVAYFFRLAFDSCKPGGAFGLIATNTIGQGDTRFTGLGTICSLGGIIYSAWKRIKWPGLAAVVVSVVHVVKNVEHTLAIDSLKPFKLDGQSVERITAYLFHAGSSSAPLQLQSNVSQSFKGVDLLGMGFTFDDTNTSGETSSIAEMQGILTLNPHYAERIRPYIGGEEINTSPVHGFHRYAINLSDLTEIEARQLFPELMSIVERKVRPMRLELRDNDHGRRLKANWWKFAWPRPELYQLLAPKKQTLVCSQVSAHHQFAMLDTRILFANYVIVFPFDSLAAFCALQSRPHEIWARFFGSSMKDDLRYTPSDCFETFPFPENWQSDPNLEAIGQSYYEFRAGLMIRNNEGLTKTYNRFHDPNETAPGILKLRELHAAMDRAVLDAYGWTDLQPVCEFLLDYEVEDDEETGRARKKPWRYRWPDELRDEVLARLLALNQERAAAEQLSGAAASGKQRAGGKRKSAGKGKGDDTLSLLELE